ncbi:MAG: 16S rRNA (cytidine(1402)-2'-O)-methyltransferase [Candidatus Aminicenantia bacterium]
MANIYVISTPIGNLEDITLRAIKILKVVPLIVCEDTRESMKLLKKYNIKARLVSYYKPREAERIHLIIHEVKKGIDCALITDSGTPLVSDPGALLLREAIKKGINIVPVPGPSAVLSALMVSGFDAQSFVFVGFPPKGKSTLQNFVKEILKFPHTIVLYERANRVKKLLEIMIKYDRVRKIVICREMTKVYEEFIRGTIEEVLEKLENKEIKGEITIVIEGGKKKEKDRKALKEILKILYEKYKVPKPILKNLTKLY